MQQLLFDPNKFSNPKKQKQNDPEISVVKLLHSSGLAKWERSFLKAVAMNKLTRGEKIVLEEIQRKNPAPCGRDVT